MITAMVFLTMTTSRESFEDQETQFKLFECLLNISAPESCFNGLSVAMGVIGVSACIFLVLLTREIPAELLGGKDESQGMVGMIKQGKVLRLSLLKWQQVKQSHVLCLSLVHAYRTALILIIPT